MHNNIDGWVKRESGLEKKFKIDLTFGYGSYVQFEVEEAIPKGDLLRFQNQYRPVEGTDEWKPVAIPSPVIGICSYDLGTMQQTLVTFLQDVVENGFVGFPEQCFQRQEVYHDTLNAIHRYYQGCQEVSISLVLIHLNPDDLDYD